MPGLYDLPMKNYAKNKGAYYHSKCIVGSAESYMFIFVSVLNFISFSTIHISEKFRLLNEQTPVQIPT